MNRAVNLIKLIEADDIGSWYGVDLDGTLAFYDGFKGEDHIGDPIPAMIEKVKDLMSQGKLVKIMTARVSPIKNTDVEAARKLIQQWCEKHLGRSLPVTHEKDHQMVELWDDRVRQVVKNTGKFIDEV